jgi:hypothetical protein
MQLDVNFNATLEVDEQSWKDALETYEGDEQALLEEIAAEMEGADLDYGYSDYVTSAWICWADIPTHLD